MAACMCSLFGLLALNASHEETHRWEHKRDRMRRKRSRKAVHTRMRVKATARTPNQRKIQKKTTNLARLIYIYTDSYTIFIFLYVCAIQRAPSHKTRWIRCISFLLPVQLVSFSSLLRSFCVYHTQSFFFLFFFSSTISVVVSS